MQNLEDVLPDLHDAKIFAIKEYYHRILLNEESQLITAFATHDDAWKYKRLIYSINSAFRSFQKQFELVITRMKNP